jgi:hypothetical protein
VQVRVVAPDDGDLGAVRVRCRRDAVADIHGRWVSSG